MSAHFVQASRGGESRPGTTRPAFYAGAFDWLFTRTSAVGALVVVALGVALPSRGIGFPFCALYETLHLPCPACGMTRSVSSFLHGHWGLSWSYHPMGSLVAMAALLVASSLLWPRTWRVSATAWMGAHERMLRVALWILLTVWLVYGLGRMAMVISGAWAFPAA